MNLLEISATEAAQQIQSGTFLLDVRDPFEMELSHIEGAYLIPLAELPNRLKELPENKPIIVHCHFGRRSLTAVELLKSRGYNAVSMEGGIDAWAKTVDSKIPIYGR
jgi:sulfur-carrier protein adenylyltransferase/sulfurtransferase